MAIPHPKVENELIEVLACPKSGTHWLEALYRRSGWDCKSRHVVYSRWKGEGRVACLFREPRNMVISWCRHNKEKLTDDNIINRFHKYYRGTLVEDYLSYLPYWNDPNVTRHQFRDLYDEPPINSETKTPKHSDASQYWSSAVDRAYRDTGGYELEEELRGNGIYV